MKKLGSGGGSNKLVHPGIRTGAPSKATSPCAASQLGQSVAFKKENVEVGAAYNSGVKLGNEKALDVGAGGVGTGRTIHRAGSQNQWGSPAPGKADAPRGFDVRGRGKDQV